MLCTLLLTMLKTTNLTLLCILLVGASYAQKKRILFDKRLAQFSIVPAMGTNGIQPGSYINYFSLNLFSGYSAGNYLLEIGGLSNLNVMETRGLQFAGLTNITGANAYVGLTSKEIVKQDIDYAKNLTGLQFSGLLNYVHNTVYGGQFTGGMNTAKGALWGVQIAGVYNMVKKYTTGVQIAGLYNISMQRMDGIQIASLFNYTQGLLIGTQLGMFNSADRIEGWNSYQRGDYSAVQIGLVNRARKMNGLQIGLVNLGGKSQGLMIGLVNIYRNGDTQDRKGATAYGILNAGDFGNLLLYSDETFTFNYQLTMGNSKNGNFAPIRVGRYWLNGLIYGHNPRFVDNSRSWTAGYSVGEYFYWNVEPTPYNEYKFISITGEVLHYNYGKSTNEKINPLMKVKIAYGSKLHYKIPFHVFGGLSYNALVTNTSHAVNEKWLQAERRSSNGRMSFWPGIFFGIHLH